MNIRFLTDSCCDIPKEEAERLGIHIRCIPLAVEGRSYRERQDFTNHEFYEVLLKATSIPTTARINASEFFESYLAATKDGIKDLIVVTLCGTASGTNESAHMAKNMLEADHPDLLAQMNIHIIDSKTFTLGYGYPIMQGAKMAEEGKSAAEIIGYIQNFVNRAEIFLSCYNLDFAKKSGRISSASAFVGELLGLRPIISMTEGVNQVVEKVRGDKNIVLGVVKHTLARITPGSEYIILKGQLDPPAEQLAALMQEQLGYPPAGIYSVGASIACNTGPKVVAILFLGESRAKA